MWVWWRGWVGAWGEDRRVRGHGGGDGLLGRRRGRGRGEGVGVGEVRVSLLFYKIGS